MAAAGPFPSPRGCCKLPRRRAIRKGERMATKNRSTDARAQVAAAIEKSPLAKVKVAVSDIDGVLRGKYLHRDKALAALDRKGVLVPSSSDQRCQLP